MYKVYDTTGVPYIQELTIVFFLYKFKNTNTLNYLDDTHLIYARNNNKYDNLLTLCASLKVRPLVSSYRVEHTKNKTDSWK